MELVVRLVCRYCECNPRAESHRPYANKLARNRPRDWRSATIQGLLSVMNIGATTFYLGGWVCNDSIS